MPARQVHEVGQRREVPLEREDALGDDQRAPALRLRDPPCEVLGVTVVIDEHLRAGEAAPIGDRRVIALIREDDVARARQRGDHPRVCQVARAEQQDALAALEGREPLLQPPVDGHRARLGPRCPGAHAPAHRGGRGCLANPRMVGKSEVVARAQQQDGLTVEQDVRALRSAHHADPPIQAHGLELVDP